jgi:hypothetical protein
MAWQVTGKNGDWREQVSPWLKLFGGMVALALLAAFATWVWVRWF